MLGAVGPDWKRGIKAAWCKREAWLGRTCALNWPEGECALAWSDLKENVHWPGPKEKVHWPGLQENVYWPGLAEHVHYTDLQENVHRPGLQENSPKFQDNFIGNHCFTYIFWYTHKSCYLSLVQSRAFSTTT